MTDIHTCPAHGVTPCVTCLRAEHQRLKDAVVETAMGEYGWYRGPCLSETRFDELHSASVAAQDALAAFEAQHPQFHTPHPEVK